MLTRWYSFTHAENSISLCDLSIDTKKKIQFKRCEQLHNFTELDVCYLYGEIELKYRRLICTQKGSPMKLYYL